MLLAAVTGVARAVPLGAGYLIADVLSAGHHLCSPGRRGAVRGNLAVVCGESVGVGPLAAEVFRNYGRFLFEFLRGPEVAEVPHRFENWDALERARERGRGVILTVLHTGNWEITGARMAAAGVPVSAVAGVQLSRRWTAELRTRQERAGIRILPPSVASWRELPRTLARNEAVALLVDGNVHRQARTVPMFGRSARFPSGPAKLAARTGAALLPMYCERRSGGTLSARFLEEVPVESAGEAAQQAATELLARRYEDVLRELPGQWLIFRRFFDGDREGAG